MQLELLKERVIEEEIPQLVSIVAPAGTGKTRLLEEFLQHIDPDDGFEVGMVRCLPYGQTLTYWPCAVCSMAYSRVQRSQRYASSQSLHEKDDASAHQSNLSTRNARL